MKNFSKFYSFKTFFFNRFKGNIYYPRRMIGKNIGLENEQKAEIFRHVIFRRPDFDATEAALFHVKFRLKGMSPALNKLFSNFPIPFFAGLPGFCGKYWCLDTSNGDFHGFYKWRSGEHAEAYSTSFAVKFMSKRSVPGSVNVEILPYRENKYAAFPGE